MEREHLTYHLVVVKRQFQSRDSKRMLQCFFEESQNYNFECNLNAKIIILFILPNSVMIIF
jgi:hypothetical protein